MEHTGGKHKIETYSAYNLELTREKVTIAAHMAQDMEHRVVKMQSLQ